MADLVDFSSFSKEEEPAFVPFERSMRDNEKRANTIGYGIAGGIFALFALIVLLLYSPCNKFCERPPGACTTDQEKAAFRSACESACHAAEHGPSQAIKTEVREHPEDEKSQKMKVVDETIDGREFVDKLNACAFSGGAGTTCESIAKLAVPMGLWCAKK